MRSDGEQIARICIALTCAGLALSLTATKPAPHTPAPTPMPSARDCYYFKRLYPVNVESFEKHHLSAAQRRYIMKYAKKIPAAERRFAKWTFDADVDEGLLIYDAFPVRPDDAVGSHAAWTAMNTNVAFDPIECRPIITPNAMQGQVRVGNSRI
jgi:hypothetical protein